MLLKQSHEDDIKSERATVLQRSNTERILYCEFLAVLLLEKPAKRVCLNAAAAEFSASVDDDLTLGS